jgi:tetratricopeptide (TPR) repeat protein
LAFCQEGIQHSFDQKSHDFLNPFFIRERGFTFLENYLKSLQFYKNRGSYVVFIKRSISTFLLCGTILTGCETTNPQPKFDIKPPMASLKSNKNVSPDVMHALQLLKEEKYKEASKFINQALQAKPKSVIFHALNGLTYEKLTEIGDASGNELAAIAYENTINLDPSNAFAIIQLGKLKYREQIYDQAQEHFANALLLKPNDSSLWHELAAASYYSYDLKTALFAIEKADKLKGSDPLIHRSATMIYAALGDFKNAKKHLDAFRSKAGQDPAVEYVAARFNDWESLYKSGRIMLASSPSQFQALTPNTGGSTPAPSSIPPGGTGGASGGTPSPSTAAPAPASGGGGGGGDSSGGDGSTPQPSEVSEAANVLAQSLTPVADEAPAPGEAASIHGPQIIIDCYLLRITEDAQTSKGNNILDNLAVTLNPGSITKFKGSMWGSGAPPNSAVSSGNVSTTDQISYTPDSGYKANQVPLTGQAASQLTPAATVLQLGNAGSVSGRVFTSGITWAGLTYSLNIANAVDNRTEVVSRPSLMTFLNKPSVFFSGEELVNGFSGQYGGTLVKYPVGTTLEITPESLEGDVLTLSIGVEGSLLTQPNPDLQQTVDVAKTRIDTYAKVRLGETLVLGGIYERADVLASQGMPGLQDIPVFQYFFSNETKLSRRVSIVYMLTPRSPDAVKAAVNRAMTREAVDPHLTELIARTPDWFSTHSNLGSIFKYLATSPYIYYEFRSGDILPPSWGWDVSFQEKLNELSSFLYY